MLRRGKKFGKYRIDRRLAAGGFAEVYRAYDTIEGIRVALKIPHSELINPKALEDFRKEVRLTARLDHPNILSIKNAGFVDGVFVIVTPLGETTLHERMKRRMTFRTIMDYAEQMIEALAYAHEQRIIHCDIKPENFIVFPDERLRLADFGIARVSMRTMSASGSGTLGYIAPEQAMGKPSYRSDVFSLGLVLYRLLTGKLPEWPYEWPPPGIEKLKSRHPDLIRFLRRALEVNERRRFQDAVQMYWAFQQIRPKAMGHATRRSRRNKRKRAIRRDWKAIRRKEFLRRYRAVLGVRSQCPKCGEPMAEVMQHCPSCGQRRKKYDGPTRFPARCGRCGRGMKLDWRFCPWCYGAGYEPATAREYSDVAYEARCANRACTRRSLMRFMRYCPWCRTKVRRGWTIPGSKEKCPSCGWGVLKDFFDHCPWCGRGLHKAMNGRR